jgi:hypothetical protein
VSLERSRRGIAGSTARAFVNSKLTPLVIISSVLLGLVAILALPREEEPQIKVPMVDVALSMPGASAEEVASRVSAPVERLLWEIPGVEYVYSTSQPGRSIGPADQGPLDRRRSDLGADVSFSRCAGGALARPDRRRAHPEAGQ